ncbi:MerR family transcriptional regulator [Microvirga sp. Mcv34]|uniref:MerR family transcriptional regulator n=1 Tax=Microvirga sp. Mcv34 TaxID=2926016 RepID=UPI0021C56E2D|nr:helix-turn-helix domain-containing protein [Microvirga sp. Mcv34]
MDLPIGELSRRTGVKVPTIRYYEQIGLLPSPTRTGGQQRRYNVDDVDRLNFIRHARELGFEVEAIRQLLSLTGDPDRSCGDLHEITKAHLHEVNSKIERLIALRDELRTIMDCDSQRVAGCRIIEVLADHGRCQHRQH